MLAVAAAALVGGCASPPRMRVGAFFGSPGGMRYPDPDRLGRHNYESASGERNGLVYTCGGGFIDIGHLREAADRTAYLSGLAFRKLSAGIFSERISSFSFEDTYSDATGVYLGGRALRDERPYDKVMTELLDARLVELGVQSAAFTRQAVDRVRGQWYEGELYLFTRMKEPSLDVGLADGQIMPRLVPEICGDPVAQPCPVPDLDAISQLGFTVTVEIEPWIWEKNAIYHSINLEDTTTTLSPGTHFPEILQYISNQTR